MDIEQRIIELEERTTAIETWIEEFEANAQFVCIELEELFNAVNRDTSKDN